MKFKNCEVSNLIIGNHKINKKRNKKDKKSRIISLKVLPFKKPTKLGIVKKYKKKSKKENVVKS